MIIKKWIEHKFYVYVEYSFWRSSFIRPTEFSSKSEAYFYALMFTYIPGAHICITDHVICY